MASSREDPLVSIILTTYDREEDLIAAVDSVDTQSYHKIELIIVNGYPENSVRHINSDKYNTKHIEHESNKGISQARNDGISLSKGNYVAFLDDDDRYKPRKIEKQVETFKKLGSEFGLVYCGAEVKTEEGKQKRVVPNITGDVYSELLVMNFIPTVTPMIRRDVFDKIDMFDPKLSFGEDYDLWLRIARKYKFYTVEDPLVVYSDNGDLGSNVNNMFEGRYRIVKKNMGGLIYSPKATYVHSKKLLRAVKKSIFVKLNI